MSNFYFLATLFPTFSLTEPHCMALGDVEFALEENLSKSDLDKVKQLWLLGDVEHVRSFLKNEPMRHKGSIHREDFLQQLTFEEHLPSWLTRFFSDFPTEELRLANDHLLSKYCLMYATDTCPSVQKLLSFEYHTRSILELERKKTRKIPYEIDQNFFHDSCENWPSEFQTLLELWKLYKDSPLELEQKLSEWRFAFINDLREKAPPFSLDRLIYSVALFDFIEHRRPLADEGTAQERIIKALSQ